jgi:hypothetical protein
MRQARRLVSLLSILTDLSIKEFYFICETNRYDMLTAILYYGNLVMVVRLCCGQTKFLNIYFLVGARGSVVVKALCYKPEGRGFDSR